MSIFHVGKEHDRLRILKTISWTWVYACVVIGTGLMILTLLVQGFPENEVGLWLLMQGLSMYGIFLDLGLSETVSREVAFAHGNAPHQRKLVSTALRIYAWLALTGGSAALLLTDPLLDLLRIPPNQVRTATWLWIFAGVTIMVKLGTSVFPALLTGNGNLYWVKIAMAGGAIGNLLTVSLVILCGSGLVELGFWTMTNGIFWQLLLVVLVWRVTPWAIPSFHIYETEIAAVLFAKARHWSLFSLGSTILWCTDLAIISRYLGVATITDYAIARKLMLIGIDFSVQPGSALGPYLSRYWTLGNFKGLSEIYRLGQFSNLNLALFFALTLWLSGPWLIEIWFGSGHFVGESIWFVMLIMLFFHGMNHFSLITALSCNSTLLASAATLGQGLVTFLLAILLVQDYGILGVVLGLAIPEICLMSWLFPALALHVMRKSWTFWSCNAALAIRPQYVTFLSVVVLCQVHFNAAWFSVHVLTSLGLGFLIAWNFVLGNAERTRFRTIFGKG